MLILSKKKTLTSLLSVLMMLPNSIALEIDNNIYLKD
jgi:hypothetical protein